MKIAPHQQKKRGLILVLVGVLVLFSIGLYRAQAPLSVEGSSSLLPASETRAYAELPLDLSPTLAAPLGQLLPVPWETLKSWSSGPISFALVANEDKLTPLALVPLKSSAETQSSMAQAFPELTKPLKEGEVVTSASAISLGLRDETLLISPSFQLVSGLTNLDQTVPRLSDEPTFTSLYTSLKAPIVIYLEPKALDSQLRPLISTYLSDSPFVSLNTPALVVGLTINGKEVQGSVISKNPSSLTIEPEHAYHALLLPFLPGDFELMLGGQNLSGQVSKIAQSQPHDAAHPELKLLIDLFLKEYLPATTYEKDLAPLLTGEFALTLNGGKALFITTLQGEHQLSMVDAVWQSFLSTRGNLAPARQAVTLPDGSEAFELIPSEENAIVTEVLFEGIPLKSVTTKEGKGIFQATVQNKLFISNDKTTILKALLLTREPGLNLRGDPLYKRTLQPILKNPELLGITKLSITPELKGFLGFSKRTQSDRTETQFMLIME
ncbi:hypothetical protein CO046_00915 [Candidatus Peregrinibacteria bacterium CG_4_9_14_0_2_um_filter_53_11]|nr:MAG: hypothetical protein CO046_00915 [Candidatus Peregrinibacteria bacterium CG_4_9_14_0_2_um_filter_53_11]